MLSPVVYAIGSVILVSATSFVGLGTIAVGIGRLKKVVFILVSLAAGALLGDAFIHLIPEAFLSDSDPSRVSLFVLTGILLFFVLEKILRWHHYHDTEGDMHTTKHIGHMNFISDGMHNFIDGLFIGVSYLVSIPVGIATTVAVFLHEIPQEIGDFGVLIHSGYSVSRALFLNFCVALFSLLGVIIAVIIGPAVQGFSEADLPLTAGTFFSNVASDLVPELHKVSDPKKSLLQLLFMLIGIGLMYGLLFVD